MTEENYTHLENITQRAASDTIKKYRAGVTEHGGSLSRKGILSLIAKEMRAEAIDQTVYTHCLTDGLERIRVIVTERILLQQSLGTVRLATDLIAFHNILKILDGEEQDLK